MRTIQDRGQRGNGWLFWRHLGHEHRWRPRSKEMGPRAWELGGRKGKERAGRGLKNKLGRGLWDCHEVRPWGFRTVQLGREFRWAQAEEFRAARRWLWAEKGQQRDPRPRGLGCNLAVGWKVSKGARPRALFALNQLQNTLSSPPQFAKRVEAVSLIWYPKLVTCKG